MQYSIPSRIPQTEKSHGAGGLVAFAGLRFGSGLNGTGVHDFDAAAGIALGHHFNARCGGDHGGGRCGNRSHGDACAGDGAAGQGGLQLTELLIADAGILQVQASEVREAVQHAVIGDGAAAEVQPCSFHGECI